MRRLGYGVFIGGCVAAGATPPEPPAATAPRREPPSRSELRADASSMEVAEEVQRIADPRWWPGFDARSVPLALFDGHTTLLVGHPAPPPEFTARGPWRVMDGRHPALVANTAIEIAGTLVAGVLEGAGGQPLRERAALVIHEAFHVFQRQHHADWSANDGVLFELSYDDIDALRLRMLESEALRRALAANDAPTRKGWAAQALAVRAKRYRASDPKLVEYERKSELNEGLAQYVQDRANGRSAPVWPAGGFAAEAIRERTYVSGASLAVLLDELAPAWKPDLDAWLDETLAATLGPVAPAAFSGEDVERAQARATAAVAAYRARIETLTREFEAAVGYAVVVEAPPGAPL